MALTLALRVKSLALLHPVLIGLGLVLDVAGLLIITGTYVIKFT
jgi:hypothetical protein